jgi:hypothetical protein
MTVHVTPRGKWRWHSVGRIAWRLMIEPRDIWVGVYWKRLLDSDGRNDGIEFWVCPIPMLVVNFAYIPLRSDDAREGEQE